MPLRIRPAVPGDGATILELIRGLADYEHLSHEVAATERLINAALFETPPAATALLAEDNNRAIGFALYFFNFSTFLGRPGLYLEDLFVLPDERGRGVGSALLIELARIAVAKGCGRMEWSVLDWNEPSIAFYKGLGAAPLSDWTTYRLTGETLTRLARKSSMTQSS
jgi:GNAT superfamily N-acetyltransferase